ncbi:MAG: glutamate--tRNA ligase [Candidatus Micrarchaeia archaeon]
MINQDIKDIIFKYAIKNAVDYGKASSSSVLGKVLSKLKASDKSSVQELKAEVEAIVDTVNKLPSEKVAIEYSKFEKEFTKENIDKIEATSKPNMTLPGAVVGAFATRYAPEPNGFMHIGNAKAAILAEEFSKIYKGKIFLYFDDTNPEKEKSEFVEAMKSDTNWLGINFAGSYYASDSIEEVYKYAKQAIKDNNAYVCTCTAELMKKNRFEMKECEHRSQSVEENLALFEKMLAGGFNEGEAVLRFKGDMHSANTVMRDPTIMRVKKHEHYKQGNKYIVWPTYDFNTPIMDSLHGITDAIRSKEYELRNELYYKILDSLGLRKPRVHLEARLVIKNNITHKRVLRELINEGKIQGYNDPRLVTIAALRRRGVQPEAIRKFVLRFGMSKVDSVVDISMLLDENKSIIDPIAKRMFYVDNPVKIIVEDAEPTSVELRMHPQANLGTRKYEIKNTFYISKKDMIENIGKVVRLKDLYDIRIKNASSNLAQAVKVDNPDDQAKKIQWVAEDNMERCEILIPENPLNDDGKFNEESLKISGGFIEGAASNLKNGEILQLERFGYCIVDDAQKMKFIFISK